ncbi:MAG: tetratricopeptide repeat protein [Gemmatimonadetes bacterium]|uniref:Tetratricopeptide repeat protein n=1 Tax=Candidatus Kutchimonas denitrificans TaxID=3056748 RepID=A0AAE4Z8Z2_9BACT|nr:tetratricopeptide repeat protein [Gemmatimonadota bacterium]NIR75484.1 tetratricopeptide repeat protein [Candidatus Kutchimonas denitrificans]NIS01798.1 tetratricopeptide repeat protein [Gemmatimonadota bacterium]NIT67579.1 tetratricopeptide repeat protein [Gemmatimonadota bacterium]NIU53453.1 tetratricopeptide repeat protein [Gemmatimonadota bacterium]
MVGSEAARQGTETLYLRARELAEGGALREAVGVYRQLLADSPDHLKAHNNLGFLYDRLGDSEAALAEYRAAESLDPDDVRLQCNVAAALASLGRYGEAEEKLAEALRSDPKEADIRENLGLVHYKRGLYAEAAEELRIAADLDPQRARALLYLGEALNRIDDLEGALTALRRSVEIQPSARAYYAMGIVYDRMNQKGAAQAMYHKAEELGGW